MKCPANCSPYHLSSLSVGLLYLAPFIGGVLGSSIAGKTSDIVCRWMARRNGGVFEPEFRLFMVVLVALSTVIGLWGFGWSAQIHDPWIAPTVFFGVIGTDCPLFGLIYCLGLDRLILLGFGCTLGSTVSVSFVVDSYRADAGSSLTSLNFSKNLLGISISTPQAYFSLCLPKAFSAYSLLIIGFIFSLVTNNAIDQVGVRGTFLILGGIHLGICALAIPLYIFGKRARGWTHRMGMMDWLYDD